MTIEVENDRGTTRKFMLEKDRSKSLYICSLKRQRLGVAYIVNAINLSDLFSSSSDCDSPHQLLQEAFELFTDFPSQTGCGVFGSQIVFAGGLRYNGKVGIEEWNRDIYVFDTNQTHIHDHEETKPLTKMIPCFQERKCKPLLVELAGKFYALSEPLDNCLPGNPIIDETLHSTFEVFDPEQGMWSSLPQPPISVLGGPPFQFDHSYAISGTKIYLTNREIPNSRKDQQDFNTIVLCFDVAHPDREWTQIPAFFWSTLFFPAAESPCRCIPFNGTALIVELDVENGDSSLMITYSYGLRVVLEAYLISSSEEKARFISCIPVDMMEPPLLPSKFERPDEYNLVDLGDQRACLVLSKFRRPNVMSTYDEIDTTVVLVIPFKFRCNRDCSEFKFTFFPTRYLEYKRIPQIYNSPFVLGCFVL